jgi:hypothetical protein
MKSASVSPRRGECHCEKPITLSQKVCRLKSREAFKPALVLGAARMDAWGQNLDPT